MLSGFKSIKNKRTKRTTNLLESAEVCFVNDGNAFLFGSNPLISVVTLYATFLCPCLIKFDVHIPVPTKSPYSAHYLLTWTRLLA